MERVKHGGKWVEFKRVLTGNFFSNRTRCAICNGVIPASNAVFLVKLPVAEKAIVIHEECIHPPAPFDKNNPFVWAVGKLTERWEEAQKWAAWF